MLFNSLDFCIFLPIVFAVYWLSPSRRARHLVLIAAGYVFYGWWDWRFLSLLIATSLVDFFVALALARAEAQSRRKLLLGLSLAFNLGLLGTFKYYDFFVDSFASTISFFGAHVQPDRLRLVLPVGISFYTFQSLSYSVDAYRRRIEPCRDIVKFLAFVAFFPQLLAGPIERATHLLPQFDELRTFDERRAVDGLRQALWGLFKKVVIADNCAEIVNLTFANPAQYSGSTLAMGAVLFAFQIYGDFSGYSDIAIGTAKLFNIDLMQNFAFPYFSRDIAEFWRRWHISLSTWFRDYMYIPLGGSRGPAWNRVRNTFAIFLVSGLWHGANWTFVVWGLLHALYFLPLLLADANRRHLQTIARGLPRPVELAQMLATFVLVDIAWVFFRAESLQSALAYLGGMAKPSLLSRPEILPGKLLLLIGLMLIVEWRNRRELHGLAIDGWRAPQALRWTGYATLLYLVLFAGGASETFIYFQF